ncbi:hypothetical protein M569_16386 [Genlisea aurea]|uniref:Uncharacterized protein n=1 Tax=Genlisea aurea TaxID=192259 RepID=S8C1Z0_9LAMI|nr:hypothetical protein M569_16386 [Genlisea aurea]
MKEEKKSKKNGLMSWLKLRKKDSGIGAVANSSEKSGGIKSGSSPPTPQAASINVDSEAGHSHSLVTESVDSIQIKHNEDAFDHRENLLEQDTSMADLKILDEIDLLKEQQKILSGELALHISALKLLSEEAVRNPKKDVQMEICNLKEEILKKKSEIAFLENQIRYSAMSHGRDKLEESNQAVNEQLIVQLNEKSLELEVKAADNRIIEDQLQKKISECEELQEMIRSLRQQLTNIPDKRSFNPLSSHIQNSTDTTSLLQKTQAAELEELRRKISELAGSKEELELRNMKLSEECSYAKGLASAAAVELKVLSEEVTKLMNDNSQLASELEAKKKSPTTQRRTTFPSTRKDGHPRKHDHQGPPSLSSDIKRELASSREREHSYEAALAEKEEIEVELRKKVEESKHREAYLENELANMWIQVAKLKNSGGGEDDESITNQKLDGFFV